jgi:hypothetical protein
MSMPVIEAQSLSTRVASLRLCWALAAAVMVSAAAPPAFAQETLTAQECSSIVKNITAREGSTINLEIKGADCSAGGAKLRVTYFWLDDVATGHILSGYLPPTLRQALGRDYPVVHNVVFDEVKALFDRFGQDVSVGESDDRVKVSTCFGTSKRNEFGEVVQCADDETYRSEEHYAPSAAGNVKRLPQSDFFVPLPDAENVVARTKVWPEGFRFYYGRDDDADQIQAAHVSGQPILMPDFQLWRSAKLSDFRDLGTRLRAYAKDFVENKNAGLAIYGFPGSKASGSRDHRQFQANSLVNTYGSALDITEATFLEYISHHSDISNLAYVYGTDATCGGSWQFRLSGPVFKLLIAVVENVGDRPVSIDGIDVLTDGRTELRQLASLETTPQGSWSESSIRLPRPVFRPSDGVLIPMRIEFRTDPETTFRPSAGSAYEAIRELPPNTRIFFPDSDIAKPASSFGPHSGQPKAAVFAYGPQISLKDARVAKTEIALRQVDPTAISLYVGFEIGSCPYVYAYDPDANTWRLQSRAVVGATNRALAYEDSFRLEHFDGRLKIVEVEPEASFLDDIMVDVTLADGTILRLRSDDTRLEYRDGKYFVIAYPDAREINFPGFAKIKEPIESAEVRVFGYYRQFGVPLRTVSTRIRGPICAIPRRGL